MAHTDTQPTGLQTAGVSTKRKTPPTPEEFNALFHPQTIAIIGASKNPLGGSKFYLAMKEAGYLERGGKIYLINPRETELFGEKVYPEIPEVVDLAIVAVSAKRVPQIVKDIDGKARFGVIYASGFRESGMMDLDQELREAIAQVSTHYLGPNCLGVLNTDSRVTIYESLDYIKGPVSYISQSGGNLLRLYSYLTSLGIGFNNGVSIGNCYCLQPRDFLEYFKVDGETKCIALYLESIQDGRDFMKIAQDISPKIPIVLWKTGQSARGAAAALSHTGGLAGSFKVWQAMAKQSGVMLVDGFELFADLVQTLSIRRALPKNKKVAIIVAGGGVGVEFTDTFERLGWEVPELTEETQQKLGKYFSPVNTNFKNPVDLGEEGYYPEKFAKAVKIISKDENVGTIVFTREPERFLIAQSALGMSLDDQLDITVNTIKSAIRKCDKPVFCNPSAASEKAIAQELRRKFQRQMIKAGIPIINFIPNLPRMLDPMYDYYKYLQSIKTDSEE